MSADTYAERVDAAERQFLAGVLVDATGNTWRKAVARGLTSGCFSPRWYGVANWVARTGRHRAAPTASAVLAWLNDHWEPPFDDLSELRAGVAILAGEGARLGDKDREQLPDVIRRAAVARYVVEVVLEHRDGDWAKLAEIIDRALEDAATPETGLRLVTVGDLLGSPLAPKPRPWDVFDPNRDELEPRADQADNSPADLTRE